MAVLGFQGRRCFWAPFAAWPQNRAFRSNSSGLLSQALRDFRCNPWREEKGINR
jgi:hypothetical protein